MWQRITEAADRSGSLQAAHRQGVHVRFGRDRRVAVAWACAIAAVVLLHTFTLAAHGEDRL